MSFIYTFISQNNAKHIQAYCTRKKMHANFHLSFLDGRFQYDACTRIHFNETGLHHISTFQSLFRESQIDGQVIQWPLSKLSTITFESLQALHKDLPILRPTFSLKPFVVILTTQKNTHEKPQSSLYLSSSITTQTAKPFCPFIQTLLGASRGDIPDLRWRFRTLCCHVSVLADRSNNLNPNSKPLFCEK